MAEVRGIRMKDLPKALSVDPESYVIIEKPEEGVGTYMATVRELQEAITVTANVRDVDRIIRISIDDINGHTQTDIYRPKASVKDNGNNTVTITCTDDSGTTEETVIQGTVVTDPEPTPGSGNFLTSGTLYNEFEAIKQQIQAMQQEVYNIVEQQLNRTLTIEDGQEPPVPPNTEENSEEEQNED